MRKAEDFCKDLNWTYDSDPGRYDLFKGLIEPIVRKAQLEAIEETCKVCAEKADLEYAAYEWEIPEGVIMTGDNEYGYSYINKDSILNCIEILKKEIE